MLFETFGVADFWVDLWNNFPLIYDEYNDLFLKESYSQLDELHLVFQGLQFLYKVLSYFEDRIFFLHFLVKVIDLFFYIIFELVHAIDIADDDSQRVDQAFVCYFLEYLKHLLKAIGILRILS